MSDYLKILIFFLCFYSHSVLSQTETPEELYHDQPMIEHAFNETEWKSIIDGIDYSGKAKKKNQAKEKESQKEGRRYPGQRSTWEAGGIGAIFMRFLLILLLVALVIILVRHLLGLEGVSRQKKAGKTSAAGEQINLEQIEENIHETDLERYIRQALEKEDYGLAIRLYYLAILKELSLKRIIKWKKDKTNRDYQRELRQTNFAEAFSEVTYIFERAWYGRNQLRESDYKQIEPKFQRFMVTLKK